MIKYSICIPAFKAKYLKECIESILNQTYTNFEIVVVDDHSPYNLKEIIDNLHNEKIRYYYNEVGCGGYNVVYNWNKCLEYAKGDYVICMGDDDKLLPNCLEDYTALIAKYPDIDVFHARTEIIDENSHIIDMQEPRPEWESIYSMMYNLWKGRDQFIGDFLFKTARLRELGGFYYLPYAWSSDKITAYMMSGEKGIANTYLPSFQYRRSSITITNSMNSQRERYISLLGELKWYDSFFTQKTIYAQSPLDEKYYQLCCKRYKPYMASCLNTMLQWDLQDHPLHITYWLSKRKEYRFTTSYCLQKTIFAIRMIISKVYHTLVPIK